MSMEIDIKRGDPYQSRVHETNSCLASQKALFIDAREDGGECWCSSRGTADERRAAFVEDDNVVADLRHIRLIRLYAPMLGRKHTAEKSGYPRPSRL